MPNRRKSARSKTATAKKSETPEKQTRRSHRRGRRAKKSTSPEDSGSDDSNVEESVAVSAEPPKTDEESNDCVVKNSLEEHSQGKEDESGGSDGAWHVKSENGGGGGIPKLKLCLQRPPELSSPTSEQAAPSPKRKKRTRGASTPSKETETEESADDRAKSPKRSTRSTRLRGRIEELAESKPATVPEETKAEVEEEEEESPAFEAVSENHVTVREQEDEDDSQPVKEQAVSQPQEVKEVQLEEIPTPEEAPVKAVETPVVEETVVVEVPAEEVMKEVAVEEVMKEVAVEEVTKEVAVEEVTKEVAVEEEAAKEDPVEEEAAKEDQVEEEVITNEVPAEQEDATMEVQEEATPVEERASSPDSTEERAKEAALKSRRPRRVKEGSEDGELVDSDPVPREGQNEEQRGEEPNRTRKDSGQGGERVPVVRKRRWGSSSSSLAKQRTVVNISTDVLREIIPEAKPVPLDEVQLSPNAEPEEEAAAVEEGTEPRPIPVRLPPSDESEKDYEEDAESGEETSRQSARQKTERGRDRLEKEREPVAGGRRVSVMPADTVLPVARSPSPAHHKPSNVLYVVNLVRPFTVVQLKELLARTGRIVQENGFWIDKIKSRCYVKYETEEEARATRHALHGIRWPVSNPKQLDVDFATEAALQSAMEGAAPDTTPGPLGQSMARRERERERDKEREREREEREKRIEERERERAKLKEARLKEDGGEERAKRPVVEPLVRDRPARRVTVPVREWDVGKKEDGFSPPPEHGQDWTGRRGERRVEYERGDRRGEEDKKRGKDRSRRSNSAEPGRKSKRKEEEGPAKLLDDLFRKTKATPCIYWLPLTADQIAVKEEMRRKHMAEHEKKMADLQKRQREQAKRNSDRRRQRSKSRSRSRSPRK